MDDSRRARWQTASLASVLALSCLVGGVSAGSTQFPVFPASERVALPGQGKVSTPDRALGMFNCPTTPQKLFAWYSERLAVAPWAVSRADEPEGGSGQWSIQAKHEGGAEATVNGFIDEDSGKTRLVVMLRGPGVTDEAFGSSGPGIAPPVDSGNWSPGSDPSLQAGIDSLKKVTDELSKWCADPSDQNAQTALAAGRTHCERSKAMRAVAGGVNSGSGEALSAQLFTLSVVADMDIGLALMAVESVRDHPGDLKKLQTEICPVIRRLKEEQVPGLQTVAEHAAQALAAKNSQADRDDDLPITDELLAESGEPRFEPSTTLTVTRFWTPGQEYWNEILRRTFAALKSWKANCPDQCDYIDDVYHCKVWGTGDEAREHCGLVGGWVGSKNDQQNQRAVMSDPCTLFGLAAASVAVGDPKQLEQGGEIIVWVDGDELMRWPLKPMRKPYHASGTRREMMETARRMGQTVPAEVWDSLVQMMERAYGDEAARHFEMTQRAEPLVAERGGGEFNGYADFVPIGSMPLAGLGGDMILAPIPPAVGFPACYDRAKDIVEKHHPALRHGFLVELQAVVGGEASKKVAINVPAVLSDPPGVAGEWDGNWPGGTPRDDWRFNQQLGPQPEPECPDRLDVSQQKIQLMADATKLARSYELLIVKKWLERLRRELASRAGKKLGADLRELLGMPPLPKPSGELVTGQQVMQNAVDELGKWSEKKLIGKTPSDLRRGNLEGLMSTMCEEAMGKGICDDLFKQAETWRGCYELTKDDPTRKALTPYGLRKLHYHRFQICNIGEAYLKIGKALSWPDKFAQTGNSIGGTYLSQKIGKLWIYAKAAYGGATAGWVLADLYAIVQIEQELQRLAEALNDPQSWSTP